MPKSLKSIGNKLGHFLKNSEGNLRGKYASYARICVEMDLSRALPDEVTLEVYDKEWVQTVDYEHIPFICHKFHEHGHLFMDLPLSKTKNNSTTHNSNFFSTFMSLFLGLFVVAVLLTIHKVHLK